MPQSATVMDEYTISDLRKEDVVKKFTTTSTLYIPPREIAPVDQRIMQALEFSGNGDRYMALSQLRGVHARNSGLCAYGPAEQAAVDKLDHHTPPDDYEVLRASPAIRRFTEDLALKPDLRSRYKEDPLSVLDAIPGLTSQEKFALSFDKPGPVYKVMRATPAAIAAGQEHSLDEIAGSADSESPGALATTIVVIVHI